MFGRHVSWSSLDSACNDTSIHGAMSAATTDYATSDDDEEPEGPNRPFDKKHAIRAPSQAGLVASHGHDNVPCYALDILCKRKNVDMNPPARQSVKSLTHSSGHEEGTLEEGVPSYQVEGCSIM